MTDIARSSLSPIVLIVMLSIAGCHNEGTSCVHRGANGVPQYQDCLKRNETAVSVTEFAPFTVLTIDYYRPGLGGYYFPDSKDKYLRILHRGRVALPRAERVQPWTDLGRNVLLATVTMVDDAGLHLLDAGTKGLEVHHLPTGYNGFEEDPGFEHGYPWEPGRRYLPRRYGSNNSGFLLNIDPLRLQTLPEGSADGIGPTITTLAAVSPDGSTFAYVNSRTTPSAIMAVTAAGALRDPIALPLMELASVPHGISPYKSLQNWFTASYTWRANSSGELDIVSRQPETSPLSMSDALESLFTNALHGYRQCFSPGNQDCLSGWKLITETEKLTGACCNSSSTYMPTSPVTTFGTSVLALSLRRLIDGGSGYALLVEGDVTELTRTLEQRFRRLKIPFVRADRCPDLLSSHDHCEQLLRDTINWRNPPTDSSLLSKILLEAEEDIVYITPTLAFGIYPSEDGRIWILSIARYVMPPLSATEAAPAATTKLPLFHRG